MQRKRHSAEQIIRKLREAEVELANGASIADVCKKLGVSETTFGRWRAQFGSMTTDDVRRLKDLEKENQRLKQAVADLTLDKQILQEALRGNS